MMIRWHTRASRSVRSVFVYPSFANLTRIVADLFPETTILFADIAGFTAWSSGACWKVLVVLKKLTQSVTVREPSQVFILLETLYHAFDVIAKQRGVFKVETVGDCCTCGFISSCCGVQLTI